MHSTLSVILQSLLLLKSSFDVRCDNTNQKDVEDPGLPLILTPYIETGKIEEARNLARVEFPGFPGIKSYAGFFTVDKNYNSNQFLWYFPAETYIQKQALILWLQGGPGASSLFGLFNENGPIQVKNGSFDRREIHWAKHHHLIYIDSPVGAGFSFTDDTRGYCNHQTLIGEHLYTTLIQFFQLFPELQNFTFFVSGESYGGKYVPALGYTIHKKNPAAELKINLKGLIIGNGWSDPLNQLDYSDYLYQIGLIDWNHKKNMERLQNQAIKLIELEAWADATDATVYDLYGYIDNHIGNISMLNYLLSNLDPTDNPFSDLIQTSSIRRAIHVGNLTFDTQNMDVFEILKADIMKSVVPWITELLDHYQILFYNGQLDINVAYPLTVNFLRKLKFSASEEYLKADRKFLVQMDNMEQIGYVKHAGKLTEAMIKGAGHMVPADQPDWIYGLIIWWRLKVVGSNGDEALESNEVLLNATNFE